MSRHLRVLIIHSFILYISRKIRVLPPSVPAKRVLNNEKKEVLSSLFFKTDIINIPKINLKNDDEGHIYVESVTNVPVTVVNEDRDKEPEKRDNNTEKRDTLNKTNKIYINSTKSYLSEDMIKNYYRNITRFLCI